MPAYFFHVRFELYPSRSSPDSTFTPPAATDIFGGDLPAHRSGDWASLGTRTSRAWDRGTLAGSRDRPLAPSSRFSPRTRRSLSNRLDSPVPVVKPATARTGRSRKESVGQRDWRFDSISILSIDMHAPSLAPNAGGLATKGSFIPSDPKDTDVGWGVVHLYRDGHETPGLYDEAHDGAGTTSGDASDAECTTLCILAVPAYMTPSDFLGFMGEQTREDVSHFRLVRTSRANKYMVLMKFRNAAKARAWRQEWNGKAFNSMEPEYCHVVFVKSITFQNGDSTTDPSSFPDLTNDPFAPASAKQPPIAPLPPADTPSLTAKPHAPPTPALVELPTCPVCLERMDETTGLLTILCQHVFHCACLEKWRGSGCPVCRYTQNDASSSRALDGESPDNECSVCGSTENLWICLVCGNTGCGRYDSAHAFAHYEATSHTYAMDVATQHVWDYAGDGYVHRLIQNKADGKLVDLPASTQQSFGAAGMTGYANDTVPREKLDNMGMEYAYLLTSQLESQRAYFEEQLERAVDKAAKASSSADEATRALSSLTHKIEALTLQHAEAQKQIAQVEKEAARNAQKASSASDLARKLTKQYKEEQTVNESLLARIKHLENKADEAETRARDLEAQKRDLEEQNRDLSFFISGQAKLSEMRGDEGLGLGEGEIEGAMVEVVGGREKEKGKESGRGRGKKKKG